MFALLCNICRNQSVSTRCRRTAGAGLASAVEAAQQDLKQQQQLEVAAAATAAAATPVKQTAAAGALSSQLLS
jgi:hypothetical protein